MRDLAAYPAVTPPVPAPRLELSGAEGEAVIPARCGRKVDQEIMHQAERAMKPVEALLPISIPPI